MPNGNPFQRGDRLKLTEAAAAQFPQFRGLLGTVLHQPKQPHSVGVRFPGRSAVQYFAVGYLERDGTGSANGGQ